MKLEQAARQALDWIDANAPRYVFEAVEKALAEQAEQEPVAWIEVERGIPMFMNFTEDYKPNINNGIAPLYAAPVSIEAAALAEREACAKVCEDLSDSLSDGYYTPIFAAAIRARGEK